MIQRLFSESIGKESEIYTFAYFRSVAIAAGDAIVGVYTAPGYIIENPNVSRAKWFAEACKEKYGKWPGEEEARAFAGVEAIMEGVKAAGTTETEAVIDAIENLEYRNNILVPSYKFRKENRQADSGIYSAIVIKDPKYTYRYKIIAYDDKPHAFFKPAAQPGCEEFMKRP